MKLSSSLIILVSLLLISYVGKLANAQEGLPSILQFLLPDEESSTPAFRINYTNGTNDFSDYVIGDVVGRDAHGNRLSCVISHFSYDDPIIFPNEPGRAHLHMFWGSGDVDAFTSEESIQSAGTSSCTGGTNYRAGAWVPALFNSDDEVVIPRLVHIYYKLFGHDEMRYDLVREIPQGIAMLASSDTLNYFEHITSGYGDHEGPVFFLNIRFPSCVATSNGEINGEPILSYQDMPGEAANQVNSHVAYPGGNINEVGCPVSHPYRFAAPEFVVNYDSDEAGGAPYLSSDAMNGAAPMSTLHGDYMFGIEPEVNQDILRCVQEARDCGFEGGFGALEERFIGPLGTLYDLNGHLLDDVDATPFGTSLMPMISDGHNHEHAMIDSQ